MDFSSINWGSVADWAAALGSIFAALVALHLARQTGRIQISAFCGIRVIISGAEQTRLASIMVTNVGDRPFRISTIGLSHGLLIKHHGIIKIGATTEYCESLLRVLEDGDRAHFGFLLDSDSNWIAHQGRDFHNWLDLATFRVTIYCTNGQSLKIKPERELLNEIWSKMKQNKIKLRQPESHS
ncbi:hypothetical protein ICA16_20965 [Pseudomonas anatoliensis]|uniref:hypothetical protein n=1 Tax=Pseudomonas anatoliensis TaxID=2710589 RepID=UPI001B31CBE3|nr:hypothetical protein [Pseudomonas anatoliensis]MBP5958153.1 hypothetical protein [Pseudomonas anatoliensis]